MLAAREGSLGPAQHPLCVVAWRHVHGFCDEQRQRTQLQRQSNARDQAATFVAETERSA